MRPPAPCRRSEPAPDARAAAPAPGPENGPAARHSLFSTSLTGVFIFASGAAWSITRVLRRMLIAS